MRDGDAGFLDDEMQIAMPAFCMDLAEWNNAVATEVALLDLQQTRYRLFLVLPPDFHQKPGANCSLEPAHSGNSWHILTP
jgi:hypothetical protein